jgi:hypothetical protein
MNKIGYSQPFKMVGKVAPENKNQSKSSIMMREDGTDNPPNGQVEIRTGTNNVNKRLRRETSEELAQAVAQGANVQGYTKSGSRNLELFDRGEIVDYSNTRGGTRGNVTGLSDQPNNNINVNRLTREINRALRSTGSVSVENGVVTSGATITRPMTEGEKRAAAQREESKKARELAQAETDAKKAELQAKRNAQIEAARAKREADQAERDAKKQSYLARRGN